jgi:hypothetical protein
MKLRSTVPVLVFDAQFTTQGKRMDENTMKVCEEGLPDNLSGVALKKE